jgi:hypothetical protein
MAGSSARSRAKGVLRPFDEVSYSYCNGASNNN